LEDIHVSKRNIFIAAILAVVIVMGFLVLQNWPLRIKQDLIPTSVENSLASLAAVSAMDKFFQVDYQEGKEAWLTRICEVSTPAGCEIFTVGVDHLWEKYLDARTVVSARSEAVEKLADNGDEQVWKMSITLSSALPGSNKTQDTAYIVLVETDGGWKFDRFLLEAESNAILTHLKLNGMENK
jgi:hypothetical protein